MSNGANIFLEYQKGDVFHTLNEQSHDTDVKSPRVCVMDDTLCSCHRPEHQMVGTLTHGWALNGWQLSCRKCSWLGLICDLSLPYIALALRHGRNIQRLEHMITVFRVSTFQPKTSFLCIRGLYNETCIIIMIIKNDNYHHGEAHAVKLVRLIRDL